MIENIKGMFFDLDDTLINFGGVTKKAWELTCEKVLEKNSTLNVDSLELANKIYDINEAYWADEDNRPKGNTDFRRVREEVLTMAFTSLGLENRDTITFLLDNYSTYKEAAVYLFPDVHETLQKLKEMDIKLVLITNGDGKRQRGKIVRFDLEKYFDLILIEGEQGFGKPDKRVYQKALDICGITADQACMVGDNYLWEVETPIKYGMKGAWVNIEDKPLPKESTVKPDIIIKSISELLNW